MWPFKKRQETTIEVLDEEAWKHCRNCMDQSNAGEIGAARNCITYMHSVAKRFDGELLVCILKSDIYKITERVIVCCRTKQPVAVKHLGYPLEGRLLHHILIVPSFVTSGWFITTTKEQYTFYDNDGESRTFDSLEKCKKHLANKYSTLFNVKVRSSVYKYTGLEEIIVGVLNAF